MTHWKNKIENLNGVSRVIYASVLALFVGYFIINLEFKGPAYLADEVGYLSKAIFLSGHQVDGASSYHFGYSILLAPLFALFSDTDIIWHGIVATNVVLILLSFIFITKSVPFFFNEPVSPTLIAVSVLVGSLYPTWLTMVGYSFSTCLQVLLFAVAVYALTRLDINKPISTLQFSVLISLYYWVHPTGLALFLASTIVIGYISHKSKNISFMFLHVAILILSYLAFTVAQGWINSAMTPAGQIPVLHYPSSSSVLMKLSTLKGLISFGYVLLSQASGLIISTFGLVVFTFLISRDSGQMPRSENRLSIHLILYLFSFISLGSLLLMSALSMSGGICERGDLLIYARYIEPILPAFLCTGFIKIRKFSHTNSIITSTFVFIVVAALITDFLVASIECRPKVFQNIINIISFWPTYTQAFQGFLPWFLLGACAMLLGYLFRPYSYPLIMLMSLFFVSNNHLTFHRSILENYSKRSPLIQLIQTSLPAGTCIGYDALPPDINSQYFNERYNSFLYYLVEYQYRRMGFEEWQENCLGPLLTLNGTDYQRYNNIRIIARDYLTGLTLIDHKSDQNTNYITSDTIHGLGTYQDFSQQCLAAGCFSLLASEAKSWSQVGTFIVDENLLETSGQPGFLFYGPYTILASGHYRMTMQGVFRELSGAYIEVVANNSKIIYSNPLEALTDGSSSTISFTFFLDETASNVEFRLFVTNTNDILFQKYQVNLADE